MSRFDATYYENIRQSLRMPPENPPLPRAKGKQARGTHHRGLGNLLRGKSIRHLPTINIGKRHHENDSGEKEGESNSSSYSSEPSPISNTRVRTPSSSIPSSSSLEDSLHQQNQWPPPASYAQQHLRTTSNYAGGNALGQQNDLLPINYAQHHLTSRYSNVDDNNNDCRDGTVFDAEVSQRGDFSVQDMQDDMTFDYDYDRRTLRTFDYDYDGHHDPYHKPQTLLSLQQHLAMNQEDETPRNEPIVMNPMQSDDESYLEDVIHSAQAMEHLLKEPNFNQDMVAQKDEQPTVAASTKPVKFDDDESWKGDVRSRAQNFEHTLQELNLRPHIDATAESDNESWVEDVKSSALAMENALEELGQKPQQQRDLTSQFAKIPLEKSVEKSSTDDQVVDASFVENVARSAQGQACEGEKMSTIKALEEMRKGGKHFPEWIKDVLGVPLESIDPDVLKELVAATVKEDESSAESSSKSSYSGPFKSDIDDKPLAHEMDDYMDERKGSLIDAVDEKEQYESAKTQPRHDDEGKGVLIDAMNQDKPYESNNIQPIHNDGMKKKTQPSAIAFDTRGPIPPSNAVLGSSVPWILEADGGTVVDKDSQVPMLKVGIDEESSAGGSTECVSLKVDVDHKLLAPEADATTSEINMLLDDVIDHQQLPESNKEHQICDADQKKKSWPSSVHEDNQGQIPNFDCAISASSSSNQKSLSVDSSSYDEKNVEDVYGAVSNEKGSKGSLEHNATEFNDTKTFSSSCIKSVSSASIGFKKRNDDGSVTEKNHAMENNGTAQDSITHSGSSSCGANDDHVAAAKSVSTSQTEQGSASNEGHAVNAGSDVANESRASSSVSGDQKSTSPAALSLQSSTPSASQNKMSPQMINDSPQPTVQSIDPTDISPQSTIQSSQNQSTFYYSWRQSSLEYPSDEEPPTRHMNLPPPPPPPPLYHMSSSTSSFSSFGEDHNNNLSTNSHTKPSLGFLSRTWRPYSSSKDIQEMTMKMREEVIESINTESTHHEHKKKQSKHLYPILI